MSSNLVCKPPYVVVMEDSKAIGDVAIQVIRDELNLPLKIVKNREEAVQCLDREDSPFFILDNWVGENKHEGLDTLDIIKQKDKNVFAGILTGYATPELEKQASKLNADFFKEKTAGHPKQDMQEIAEKILTRWRNSLEEQLKNIDEKIESLQEDPNITAYEKEKSDQKWFKEYQGKYVAFVDGDFVGSDEDEDNLRQRLRQSEYRDKWRFITKVEENMEIIDLPSSLWFDNLKLEL